MLPCQSMWLQWWASASHCIIPSTPLSWSQMIRPGMCTHSRKLLGIGTGTMRESQPFLGLLALCGITWKTFPLCCLTLDRRADSEAGINSINFKQEYWDPIMFLLLGFRKCPYICVIKCSFFFFAQIISSWFPLTATIKSPFWCLSPQVANTRSAGWKRPSTLFYPAWHLVSTWRQRQALS